MLIRSTETNKKELPVQKLFLIWSYAIFITTMNSTMFNVALPSVQADLAITISSASWIISGYSVVLAVSTLTFSRLSEFIPVIKLLLFGITLLGVGSLIGYVSYHYIFILITRLLQAIGAGAIVSLAIVVVTRFVPVNKRAKTLAITSSAAVFGLGLGPVIGGVIDQYLGWNSLFLVTASVLILIPLFMYLLPKEEQHVTGMFDTKGCTITSLAVVCLMLFFSTFNLIFIVLFLIFITLTSKHLNRVDNAFIKAELLKNIQYTHLLYISFIAFFVYFATLFLLPLMLSDIYQMQSMEIGLLVLPGAIVSVLAANKIGSLINRFGNGPILFGAHVLFLIAILLFIFLSRISSVYIIVSYLLINPGFTALTTSSRNEVSRILNRDEIGAGVGLMQLIQFFGGAFGVTITGTMLSIQEGSSFGIYRNVYIVLIVLACISAVLLYRNLHRSKITNEG